MEGDDRKTDEPGEGMSFAEMLDESYVEPGRLEPGAKVTAKIVKISAEWIFLDLGRKGEGILDRKELCDAEGNLGVKEGDPVEAYFTAAEGNELRFTTKIAGGAAGLAQLEDAWRSGIPVEGVVDREVKGGYEVRIAGGRRGFCPHSRMGLPGAKEPAEVVGKHLSFRITDFREKGRTIVLSNREILEEKRRAELAALRASIREGMTVRGTVTSVRDFGAFVTAGGLDGLVPASEVGWERGVDVRDLLSPGQEVDVVVVRLDWEKERFTFSLKQALADPWEEAAAMFPAGSVHRGKVVRLADFGLFVSLRPGVDGLLHASRLGGGKRIGRARGAFAVGDTLEVKVESVDPAKKRISLSPAAAEGTAGESAGEEEDYGRYAKEPARETGSLGDALRAKLEQKKAGGEGKADARGTGRGGGKRAI